MCIVGKTLALIPTISAVSCEGTLHCEGEVKLAECACVANVSGNDGGNRSGNTVIDGNGAQLACRNQTKNNSKKTFVPEFAMVM